MVTIVSVPWRHRPNGVPASWGFTPMRKSLLSIAAAAGLALGLTVAAPSEAVGVCRNCTLQGVAQGAGIVPDPGQLVMRLDFGGYGIRSPRVAAAERVTFVADSYPASTAGNFDLTGQTTTTIRDNAGNVIGGNSRLVRSGDKAVLTVRDIYGSLILRSTLTVTGKNFTGGATRLAGETQIYEVTSYT